MADRFDAVGLFLWWAAISLIGDSAGVRGTVAGIGRHSGGSGRMDAGLADGVARQLHGLRGRAHADEELFLAIDKARGVEGGDLEAVAVGDGVGGAGLDAVSAEDAAVVIDVIDRGVALGAGDAALGSVLRGLDVDAVRGTRRGTEKTGHALFKAVLVAL